MKNKLLTLAAAATIMLLALTLFACYPNFSNAEDQAAPETDEWQLTISGLVQTPLTLNLSNLKAMPQTTENATIYCVDFPGTVVTQGSWKGVQLSYLLDQAGVDSSAVKVILRASDGYSTDLSMEQARRSDIIVAYEKNGVVLPETLRLVVPGNWGYKWIAQLTSIELVNYNYLGRWESLGYPDEAKITSSSSSGGTSNGGIPGTQPYPSTLPTSNPTAPPSTATATPTNQPTPVPSATSPVPTETPQQQTPATQTPTATPTQTPTATPQPQADSPSAPNPPSPLPYVLAAVAATAAIISVAAVVWRKRKTPQP